MSQPLDDQGKIKIFPENGLEDIQRIENDTFKDLLLKYNNIKDSSRKPEPEEPAQNESGQGK